MVASRSSFADRPSLNLTHRSGNRGVLSSQVKLTTSSAHLNHKCLLLMSLTYISGLTLSITQLTTFYRKMMSRGGGSGRGRPHKLPGVVAPSKVKRICGAEGCGVHVVGTLEGLVDEVIDTMKADFVYKRDNLGKLVTPVNRLADPDHGSAIQSFRKN